MFKLPPLPYAYDALEPTVSAETMRLHHDRHHAAYFKTTNDLVAENNLRADTLEDVVLNARRAGARKLFNHAAQAWNHTFFWISMSPASGPPEGDLAGAINAAFGDMGKLKARFAEEGAGHFGSGWVWIVASADGVRVTSTHDGENLLQERGVTPLLVCDLWEHAYYVDYRNDRKAYLEAWFDALPNWDFAAGQLKAARGGGHPWRHPAPEAGPSTQAA